MFRSLSMRKGSLSFLLLLLFSLMGMIIAPLAVQAAPSSVADPETVHIVQRGDTLSAIARRYGVTVEALVAYNSLSSTTIYVGQRLLIPGQSAPTYPITYIVQRGDTLYKIARRYDTTVAALMQVNNLRAETIYVGQRLTISVAGDPNQPLLYHTVQRGDTLSALARRYNVSVAAMRAANGLTSDAIYVGQRLLIPNSLGYPTPLPTQQPVPGRERIQFAPGATSATVRGTVQFPNRREYVLRALGGQAMRVELISSDASANFALIGVSDGQPLKRLENSDTVWTGALPSTQDYLLQVTTPTNAAVSYELYVEVTSPPSRTPVRIQFASGATAATVSGFTSAIEPARYVLHANAGQTMSVDLTVDNANAYITVLHPTGGNMAGAGGPIHRWSGVLPVTGDYVIEVLNPGTGLANFNLTVAIQ
ncbi:MAG: LysM peptidoglycan-binding domain-containing protein [Caldilineaceae bacterium]